MRPVAFLALAVVLVLAGCRPAPETPAPAGEEPAAGLDTSTVPGTALLTGSVLYLQRIALPPDAEVSVTLQEVSRADAPAVELASTSFQSEGRQVPLPFTLTYEPEKIAPAATYSLAARISNAGELLWISDAHTPVLTRGAPMDSIEVRVAPVPK